MFGEYKTEKLSVSNKVVFFHIGYGAIWTQQTEANRKTHVKWNEMIKEDLSRENNRRPVSMSSQLSLANIETGAMQIVDNVYM